MTRPIHPPTAAGGAARPFAVHTLRLTFANVHLVVGPSVVLIDTGSPGNTARILSWVDGIGAGRPSAIVLTHGHGDHAGSARELRDATQAPVWLARADWTMVEVGRNPPLRPTRASAIPLKYMVPNRFPAFRPDRDLTHDSPAALGLAARLVPTPGHTPGSISLVLDGGQAIVGDLLMGGYLGGQLRPSRPRPHYFADDRAALGPSLARVLAAGATTLHLGHGGPISAADLSNGYPE
jgi:glyoxylase-like metal-dependent hydrolase (beta-lactamase superfamily II)